MNTLKSHAPGLLLVFSITCIALGLERLGWGQSIGFSALTLAIVLGMIVGNFFYTPIANSCFKGVTLAKGKILRLGIILYGFRLTFQQIANVGITGIIIDAIMLSSTFFLTLWLAIKVFKMDKDSAILIGSGCGICGAAAIMATEPLLKSEAHKVTVAVAVVVIFGTLGIFLYPFLYHLNWFGLNSSQFGIYIGASVHEVAQVVAAGKSINQEVANNAVIVKMIRVMMLAPFLLLLSFYLSKSNKTADAQSSKISIPWFALWFILIAGFNSFNWLPENIVHGLILLDTWLLAMAMAALGVTTHFAAIRHAGARPIILGGVIFLWLVVGGALLSQLLT